MRTLRFLLQKEFKQIFRNKALLPMIFAMPLVQLLIMPLAADYEVKNINISIVDRDQSSFSRQLTRDIIASGYFVLQENTPTFEAAFQGLENDRTDLILEIPSDFEKELIKSSEAQIFIAVNAINGTKANIGGAYAAQIVQRFNQNIRLSSIQATQMNQSPKLEVTASYWFNPDLNYRFFMVPGILAVLVTMVGAYMCALNIVKEKEIGTIEQINVTPIRKHHFILGKLIPFWIIGVVVFTIGLFVVGYGVYGIIPMGNLLVLYGYLSLYLVALLGLGLLISTYSETQQQAMSVAFFFMMIFMLMSGLFTPVDSMPDWSKVIAKLNPVTYFIEVTRMIILKGSGLQNITKHFLIMIGFAVLFNTWAIKNYRKTT